jgi:hypothetical protein
VLGALYCVASWCLQRGLQARRVRRPVLQVLEALIEASANIVVKAESVQVSAVGLSFFLRLGDYPSFYRPRRRQFTSMPHCFVYVKRHGVQRCGVDGRPGESCIWRGVMACPVSVQERLKGWWCRDFSFSRRPYIGFRVRLTGGRREHSNRRGGVLSPCPPPPHSVGDGDAVLGMALGTVGMAA